MEIRVIHTPQEHRLALSRASTLMTINPAEGTPEAEELRALATLIDEYERRTFPTEMPDPIEAIKFRMEEQNLSHRDLIPYMGSRSRVSEILAGKRPLTLSMIQSLSSHFGIPAEILIQPPRQQSSFDWKNLPIQEMVRRAWILPNQGEIESLANEFMRPFEQTGGLVLTKTDRIRSARKMDQYSLAAWAARTLNLARDMSRTFPKFNWNANIPAIMKDLAHLSTRTDGPKAAKQHLAEQGIAMVVESHLPQTYLDGAALLLGQRPVIGMTIRHDRLDNFWFCLMHELAHLALHIRPGSSNSFFDDLEVPDSKDEKEREADSLASESLIPEAKWRASAISRLKTPQAVRLLAKQLNIHESVVAGRARREANSYRLFPNMLGYGAVRQNFPGIQWK